MSHLHIRAEVDTLESLTAGDHFGWKGSRTQLFLIDLSLTPLKQR